MAACVHHGVVDGNRAMMAGHSRVSIFLVRRPKGLGHDGFLSPIRTSFTLCSSIFRSLRSWTSRLTLIFVFSMEPIPLVQGIHAFYWQEWPPSLPPPASSVLVQTVPLQPPFRSFMIPFLAASICVVCQSMFSSSSFGNKMAAPSRNGHE